MNIVHSIPSGRAALAVRSAGAGDPVVFLHAGVADSRMWLAQLDGVAATHHAIAYDRRGFGNTRAEAEDFSPVGDLLAVIDAVGGGGPAILVGCSQGGRVALDAALAHPSRIRGLVLIAPAVSGAPAPSFPPEIAAMVEAVDAAEEAGDLDAVNALEARIWLDGPLAAEGRVTGPARRLFLGMNGIALRAPDLGVNLDVAPAWDRLAEVTAPTLLICGDLDFPHLQDRCRHLASVMPNASSMVVSGAAHLPNLDRPEAVTNLIAAFVQDCAG